MQKCNGGCNEGNDNEESCLDCPCLNCPDNETCTIEDNDDCDKW
jgi:hypothetical protein